MSVGRLLLTTLTTFGASTSFGESQLTEASFRTPPSEAKPHVWWHWMNGNVSKAGITADLEAMARVGIGGFQLFDAGLAYPRGTLAFNTPDWFDTLAFVARESDRLGLRFGLSNCSGWSSSGGPWVTPQYAMKCVRFTETKVKGGGMVSLSLPEPGDTFGFYRDIAIVAFPTPAEKAEIPYLDYRVFKLRSLRDDARSEDDVFYVPPIPENSIPKSACYDPAKLIVINARPDARGNLEWNAPEGNWTVLRVGYANKGMTNHPGSEGGIGYEVDKLDPAALDLHFDQYLMKVVKAVEGTKSFDNLLVDSYEVRGQNWTHGFERAFQSAKGYDIIPYLPVFAGYPSVSAAETDRFCADLRRVIADLFAKNYAGRMAERCHAIGVKFACEPYGTSPSDDFDYGIACDIPMAEFWRWAADYRKMDVRWGNRWNGNANLVASIAHFCGKPIVGCESFTAFPIGESARWADHPFAIKPQGDRILAEGVNRFWFHSFVHQPFSGPSSRPGLTLGHYGANFTRTQTWWENGMKAYCAYLTRCQYLLQRGKWVADLLIDTGDEVPNYNDRGVCPAGYSADRVNSRAAARAKGRGYRVIAKWDEDPLPLLVGAGVARDFICADPSVSWCHRRDGNDELYFVARSRLDPAKVTCSFRDTSAGIVEIWNPEDGKIVAAKSRKAKGRIEVDLEFSPADAKFVVFRAAPTPGRCRATDSSTLVSSRRLTGEWSVEFTEPGANAAFKHATFASLMDWSASTDDDIRYFSGTATYRKTLELKGVPCRDGNRVVLDLGQVRDIAEVTVNGVDFGCLWKPPFKVDITPAFVGNPRQLQLEIRVTNRWPNRIIGDERLRTEDSEWCATDPKWGLQLVKAFPDWLREGRPSPTGRKSFTASRCWSASEQLLPSGLLGPVLLKVERLKVERRQYE